MNISFIPAGDETTASTRIRVFSLRKALLNRGVSASIGYRDDADVVIIQKKVDDDTIRLAKYLKRKGCLVMFDCDDFGPVLLDWSSKQYLQEIFVIADIVTTNTESFRGLIQDEYCPKRIELVPDIIDYYLEAPEKPEFQDTESLKVLWFGNRKNVHLINRYANAFRQTSKASLTICTDEIVKKENLIDSSFAFVPWHLDHFGDIIRSFDLTILLHDGSTEDRAKSNNRMITSIAYGVPSIVSNTSEYRKLADEIGHPKTILNGPCSLNVSIEYFVSKKNRKQYIADAQPIVWKRHSPGAVSSTFLELCRACKNRKNRESLCLS